ncbi:MAG: ABC transporter ATP-binding protein [Desulfurococcales archaeon]|nr:ABC transporter ATP-binding protein [Desulfurococcales archaeon]
MHIQAENLTKYFGRVEALAGVSFDVDAKRIVVIGQNGSGKSTLLSIMYGLLRPSMGTLRVEGYEPYRLREKAAQDMSIAFERPRFDINLRVRDVYDIVRYNGAGDCVELFWDQIGVREFSGAFLPELSSGQKQLVQLMQAICRDSSIKILDEPFSHVDVGNVELIGEYILERDLEVVITTHVPEEAEWVGDHVIMLREGRVVWNGRIEDLERDNLFEVYLRYGVPDPLRVHAKLGYVAIVESSYEELSNLLVEGRIRGFKKLGVRRYFSG